MSKSSNIAKGGLFTGLSIIFIYLSSIIPTNKIALLAAASFVIPISILAIGIKMAFVEYLAVSILGFFLIPSKGIALSYILFFGLYGFVKLYTEKIRKAPLEILIKLLFFNTIVAISAFLYTQLFAEMIDFERFRNALVPTILIFEVAFIAYDYLVTLLIQYYLKLKIKN
ncbi:hypothetical protein SH2C18_24860 [Clostridium sediminicola]|uniref:hypothetical protein n=1 Tax=Clostridium sediminicola TaxID=3114879 RepID=UPI0031F1D5B4